MTFMERLKELRLEKELTQRALAKVLNVSPNCICEWEKGRSEPSIESLKILASCLECTIDYLLGFSDDIGSVSMARHTVNQSLNDEEVELLRTMRTLSKSLHFLTLFSLILTKLRKNFLYFLHKSIDYF